MPGPEDAPPPLPETQVEGAPRPVDASALADEATVKVSPGELERAAPTVAETVHELGNTYRVAPPGSPMAPPPGDRLGRFSVEAELGRGGMGRVLRARDPLLGRALAVKVLGPEVEARDKFLVEAVVSGRLEHPSIIPIYELGFEGLHPFLAMREIRGQSLAERIDALRDRYHGHELPASELATLLRVFLKICDAVAFAHDRGVIHRDLKPANVMLGSFGEVYVLDWGLAKVLDEPALTGPLEPGAPAPETLALPASERTLDGTIMGTPRYMAPEQARGEVEALDARSDIYALGAILYELASLVPAYQGRNVGDVLTLVAAGAVELPSQRLDGKPVPWELEAVIARAMALAPEDRFSSAGELAGELERFLAGELLRSASYSPGRLLGRMIARHAVWLGLLAALLLIGAVLGVLAVRQIADERGLAVAAASRAELRKREAQQSEARAIAARATAELTGRQARADRRATRALAALRAGHDDEALLLASGALAVESTPLTRAIQLALRPTALQVIERWPIHQDPPWRAESVADDTKVAFMRGAKVQLWAPDSHGFLGGRQLPFAPRGRPGFGWLGRPDRLVSIDRQGGVAIGLTPSPRPPRFEPDRIAPQRLVAVTGSSDGRWIFGAGELGKLYRWSARGGAVNRSILLGGRATRMRSLGQLLVVMTPGQVQVLDAQAMRVVRRLGTQTLWLDGLCALSADGERLALARGREAVIASLRGKDELVRLPHGLPVEAGAFLADGRLLTGGDSRRVMLWREVRRESTSQVGGAVSWIGRVQPPPPDDGGPRDPGQLFVLSSGSQSLLHRLVARPGRGDRLLRSQIIPAAIAFQDDQTLLVGGARGLERWRLSDGERLGTTVPEGRVRALLPRGTELLLATSDGLVRADREGRPQPPERQGSLLALSLTSAGGLLLVPEQGDALIVTPGEDDRQLPDDVNPQQVVSGRGWSAILHGERVISVYDDRGRQRARWLHAEGNGAIASTPDGARLACASGHRVALHDPTSGELLSSVYLAARVTALAFLDDGLLLAGDDAGRLSAIDVRRSEVVLDLTAHREPIRAIAVAPGNQRVATLGGNDVRLWGLDGWLPLSTVADGCRLELEGERVEVIPSDREAVIRAHPDPLPPRWKARDD